MGKKQKEKSVCIKVVIVIVDNEIQQNNKNQSGGQEKGKEKVCALIKLIEEDDIQYKQRIEYRYLL